MPRKFLGERVESGVDFVRPSSLTLTADDLQHIPLNGYEVDETVSYGLGSRMSRKFGGTIKLRKRLESVPELFLHDLKKKPLKKRAKKPSLRRIEPPKMTLPPLAEEAPKQLFTEDEIDKIFVTNRIVMPITVQPQTGAFTKNDDGAMSSNEQLYDEIISAYGSTSHDRHPQLLNSEIDRVLEHISHKQLTKKPTPVLNPTIYDREVPQPAIVELRPPSPVMSEKISSPEYTGNSSSDRWSSGDEFSDLGSAIINQALNDEHYVTATNSLRFNNSASIERTDTEAVYNIQPVKLHRTEVIPKTFTFEDEDNCSSDADELEIAKLTAVQLLQRKIESIEIASCSSSIYSDT